MRKGIATVLACVTVSLMLPATASAAITRLDLGPQAQLGPEGAFVTVPVTYHCDFFDGTISISVRVTQSRGNRIADGFGSTQGTCTSSPQTVLVQVESFTGVPYHQGKAVAEASGFTFPGFNSASDGPEQIRITH
jgi:hypothetical protein